MQLLPEEIISSLSAAKFGERKFLIKRYAELLQCSEQKLYRALKRKIGKQKEIVKKYVKDPGNELVHEVAKIKAYGMTGVHERELSTDLCCDILQSRGHEVEGISKATINRRLHRLGFRDKDIIVRVESAYANQTHQLDFSRSKYFQIYRYDTDRGDYLLKATNKQLTYKEHDTALRTWYVGLTDAHSRVSLAQCYAATGESMLIGIEFMNFAYTRIDEAHPLCFLPDKLKTDNGAFIKNKAVQDLLEKYEIKSELVTPMMKRGIQKQESAWKKLWREFELPLYIRMEEGSTISLKEFNELVHEYEISLLEKDHPVLNDTKGHVYLTSIQQKGQRTAGEDMKISLNRYYERVVDDTLCITIEKQKYQCSSDRINGMSPIDKKVSVWINLNGEAVAEFMEEPGKPFVMMPVDGYVLEGDFTHRFAPSYRQQLMNQMSKQKTLYLPPRKTKVKVENKFDEAVDNEQNKEFASEFEAKKYIAEQFGRNANYSSYAEIFNPLLTDTLKKKDIDEVIEGIKTGKIAI